MQRFKWMSYSLVFKITIILLQVMIPPHRVGTSQGTVDTHL